MAASWSHAFRFNSSVGDSPDARITGSVMRAERRFLTSSTPDIFGMLLSVIRRRSCWHEEPSRRGGTVFGDVHPVIEEEERSGTECANLTVVIDHEYMTGRIRLASRWWGDSLVAGSFQESVHIIAFCLRPSVASTSPTALKFTETMGGSLCITISLHGSVSFLAVLLQQARYQCASNAPCAECQRVGTTAPTSLRR